VFYSNAVEIDGSRVWVGLNVYPVMFDRRLWLRYAVVGVAVASIYLSIYMFLLFAFPSHRFLANSVAFFLAICVQYLLHSKVTFAAPAKNYKQAARFLVTVGVGYIFSFALTNVAVPRGYMRDTLAVFLVIVCLPVVNLIIFSLWVFAQHAVERRS
jgi:putative flippase GtrA